MIQSSLTMMDRFLLATDELELPFVSACVAIKKSGLVCQYYPNRYRKGVFLWNGLNGIRLVFGVFL